MIAKTKIPIEMETILIAEDSPTQAEQLRYLLAQNGFEVIVATNGKKALDQLDKKKPALILSDIIMPEMDGYDLCKNIKSNEATCEIPVILLTSLSNPEDVLEALACGADSFISKPYGIDYLIGHIQQILANWKLRKFDRIRVGVEILFAGKRRFISADQQQMLSLLLSTYEAAVQRNIELVQMQESLRELNEQLEDKVKERTAALSAEIIERKKVEESLRISERELNFVTNHAPVFIAHCDDKLRYKFVNQPYAEMFGMLPEEIIGKQMQEVLNVENFALAKPYLEATISGEYTNYDLVRPTFLKKTHAIHVSNAPELDDSGKVVGFVAAITDISAQKKAEEEVRCRLGELEVLYASSLTTSRELNPKVIAQNILDILSEKLQWHDSAIRQVQPNGKNLELLAFKQTGLENETDRVAAEENFKKIINVTGQGLAGWVIQHGQFVYSGDVTKEKRYIETWPGIRSGMYVPLKIGERTLGCLSVESDRINAFHESDEWLVTTLATQAASALENARLFNETQRHLEQILALREIDKAIAGSVNLNTVLEIALRHVITKLGVDAAVILLKDPRDQVLRFQQGKGLRTNALQFTSLQLGEGHAGQVALKKQTIYIPDFRTHKTGFLRSPTFLQEGFVCYIGVPLSAKDEVNGVLEIFHRSPLFMEKEKLDFMETLAGQIAIAIDNISMFENLQRSNIELAQAYDATIEGWSRALDLRDKETEGHTKRVTELSIKLAGKLGIPESDLIHIRWGALLHDIGKMGVPDNILLKPGPLNDEEWEIMRKHPLFAYDMLSPIHFLHPALDIPLCHHEKWDGTGYPNKLKGEDIPLVARIFSVIDVWDALISDRPYRKAWTKEKALEYICEQSRQYFDPHVVEAFLEEFSLSG